MQISQTEDFSLKVQVTPGEAYFLKSGSPHKARQDEDPSDSDGLRNPLLQFDLKFDFLRDYLGNFTTVLNQHASILNKLQIDVGARVGQLNFADSMKQCSKSGTLKDPELYKILAELLGKPLLENSGDDYRDSVNMFCNRLGIISYGFSHFHKSNKEFTARANKLETDVGKKIDSTFFKVKGKKMKKKLREELKESSKMLNDRIAELESKLVNKIDTLEEKVIEVEKQTLWRIKDCEDLLKSRVNDIYVDDAVRKMEEKLKNEIEKITVGKSENIERNLEDALNKIKQAEETTGDKLGQLKKNIKDIENYLMRKIDITKFEDFEKHIHAKLESTSDEIRTLTRRCEPAIEKVETNMKVTMDNVAKFSTRIENLSVTLENYMLIGSSSQKRESARPNKNSDYDGNGSAKAPVSDGERASGGVGSKQMIEIQAILSRYRESIDKINDQMLDIQATLKENKANMANLEAELKKKADKVEKEEKSPSRFGTADEEKLKKLGKTIQEMQQKFDKIDEVVDKKTAKIRKELDMNLLMKQIKQKADEENVQKGFENVDSKIASIAETLQFLKKEIDQSMSILQKVSVQTTTTIRQNNENASLSTKSIFPQNCLSCGNTAVPSHSIYNMQGMDKRWYKGEGDNSLTYDNVNMSEIKEGYIYTMEEKNQTTNLNLSFDAKVAQRPPRGKMARLGLTIGAKNAPAGNVLGPKPRAASRPGILDLAIQPARNSIVPSCSRPNSAKK